MSESNGNGTNGAATIKLEPFDYLAGNIKGHFAHQLTSRCVAFVGKNRKGKTARLEAFRLAFTGEHPVGPHGSNLMELAPENALSLHVVARAGDAASPIQSTGYKVEIEGGKARKAEKADRQGLLRALEDLPGSEKLLENCLPVVAMRDLIKMGSTLGREAIFRRFGDITAIPVPRGLNDAQLALWKRGLEEVKKEKPKADTSEVLAAVSSWFRKKKLEIGKDIKALEKLIKEREAALAPAAAGAEELPNLKKQLADAKAWEGASEIRAAKETLDQQAADYRRRVTPLIEADKAEVRAVKEAELVARDTAKQDAVRALCAEVDKAELQLKEAREGFDKRLKGQHEVLVQDIEQILATFEFSEEDRLVFGLMILKTLEIQHAKAGENGTSACLLCGAQANAHELSAQLLPRVKARQETIRTLRAERDATLAKFEGAKQAAEAAARVAEAEYQTWKRGVEDARRQEEVEKNALRQEGNRLKGAIEQNALALKAVPEKYEGPSSSALDAKIQALSNAETANRQLDAEVAKLRQLSLDQEVAKVLEQESAKELNSLLTRTSEVANASVNKYMPDGFVARLDLETAQWTVMGADARPHNKKVMSGSECGALVPALALAWTEGAPGRYLTLDDEDLAFFDPENLALLLQALKDACDDGLLTQVFIAWSRPHEIPDAWGQKIYVDQPHLQLVDVPPSSPQAPIVGDPGAPLLL